jgi:hypothetical protein
MLTFCFELVSCVSRYKSACSRLHRDDQTLDIVSHSLSASKWELYQNCNILFQNGNTVNLPL